ncbi:hypothetical protein IKF23_02985 [Candidatus Saccharibacteria bacterium]|nr:hypothetical protein [Candidatus Saccharibacteria bacterium]
MKTIKITKNIFSPKRVLPKFFILSNVFLFSAASVSLATFTLFNSSFVYADNLDYNVVVKPSLKLTLSSTNPSLNLNPANHTFDTTSLTATVATNYTNGYKLYLDTTNGSGGASNTELVNTTNSTYTIPTLASSSTSSSFPANYWGYKLDSASTEYLSYVPNTLISQSTTNTNGTSSSIDFAAKIDYEKPAGLYSIAFDLKTIPIVTQTYMQNMDPSVCTETPTIVIDKRDEQIYTIRRFGNDCWMIDSLRFTGNILDSTTSNVADNYTPEHPLELELEDLSLGNSYDNPRIHTGVDNYNNPTVWYNYAAASAGTITGNPNSNDAEYDVCPSNWRLPNSSEQNALVSLIGSNATTWEPINSGGYNNGSYWDTGNGSWWSSTAYSSTDRYRIFYASADPTAIHLIWYNRIVGFTVRCVLQES